MLFNHDRAVEMMRRCALDALVVSSPVNAAYLTGYACWIDPLFKEYMGSPGASSYLLPTYALFAPASGTHLILNPVFATNAMDLDGVQVHSYGDPGLDLSATPAQLSEMGRGLLEMLQDSAAVPTATRALLAELEELGLADGNLGIEWEGLQPQCKQEIQRRLPKAELRDCSNLMRVIRMVKSPEEIRRLEEAARINEESAIHTFAMARSGRSMQELVQAYRARVAELGADFDHYAYAPAGSGIATRRDYHLHMDDFLYVDFGCIYQGYFSDSGTTLSIGQPASEVLRRYQALADCQACALELIRPGVNASTLAEAVQSSLERDGITTSFPHGHGLGLEVRDYPIIVPDNGRRIRDDCLDVPSDLPMEEDMVINLESAIFLFATGSLHLEQSLVVTSDGCRPLAPHDRSQPFIVRPSGG